MTPVEKLEVWVGAYAAAFAVTALGGEIRGRLNSPSDIDQRAKALADQVVATISERRARVRTGQ